MKNNNQNRRGRWSQRGWAIMGEPGLYPGWEHTRNQTIAMHVHTMGVCNDSRLEDGELTLAQRAAWELCRRNGDRCIQVVIRPYARVAPLAPPVVPAKEPTLEPSAA